PAEAAHECGHDHHQHAGGDHAHEHPVAPAESSPLPAGPHDCVVCKFLAQPVQLVAAVLPPAVWQSTAKASTPADQIGVPAECETPPARGPPTC
ncbi:MAG: hypothetical protein ACK5Q5_18900, partial [Planctomycetaceae bacterium]